MHAQLGQGRQPARGAAPLQGDQHTGTPYQLISALVTPPAAPTTAVEILITRVNRHPSKRPRKLQGQSVADHCFPHTVSLFSFLSLTRSRESEGARWQRASFPCWMKCSCLTYQ